MDNKTIKRAVFPDDERSTAYSRNALDELKSSTGVSYLDQP